MLQPLAAAQKQSTQGLAAHKRVLLLLLLLQLCYHYQQREVPDLVASST